MFSRSTEYALRAVMYVAKQTDAGKYPGVEEIAKATGSPKSFTAKVLQTLSRDGSIISSFKGPGGGFFLVKNAGKKNLKSILKVMGEEKIFTKCLLGVKNCTDENPCPLHQQYAPSRNAMNLLFEKSTISNMVDKLEGGKVRLR
ncbi:MAG: Rrf2 family transcriptional regulator [Bacteroidia bacterium]|nr:Rrf2 family transcriptional regulator [Bacteroidia bacterium]